MNKLMLGIIVEVRSNLKEKLSCSHSRIIKPMLAGKYIYIYINIYIYIERERKRERERERVKYYCQYKSISA